MFTGIINTGWKRVLELQNQTRQMLLTGMIVQQPENIYYFSSFYPRNKAFLILPEQGKPEVVVMEQDLEEARQDCLLPVISGGRNFQQTVYDRLLATGVLKSPPDTVLKKIWDKIVESPVGIEKEYLSIAWFDFMQIRNHLDVTQVINELRSRKDSAEQHCISQAGHIAKQALHEIKDHLVEGVAFRKLSGIYDVCCKELGADESRFSAFSGETLSLTCTNWLRGELQKGPLRLECAVRYQGYWALMSRMFYVGQEPDAEYTQAYSLIREAQARALEHLVPGRNIYAPQKAMQDFFAQNDLAGHILWPAGHGIGLQIEEQPRLEPKVQQTENTTRRHPLQAEETTSTLLSRSEAEDEALVFSNGQSIVLQAGIILQDKKIVLADTVFVSDESEFVAAKPSTAQETLLLK